MPGQNIPPEILQVLRAKLMDPATRVQMAQKLALMMDAPDLKQFTGEAKGAVPATPVGPDVFQGLK